MFKANLHCHTGDDPLDLIKYSFYDAIDRAAVLGFEVLAITCHDRFIDFPEYIAYAQKRGILLIPGTEKTIEKRHVVILNADKKVESVNTFTQLQNYKKLNPDVFLIAPHPYFYGGTSLKEKLEQNSGLFDAIEYSWFYSKFFNRNIPGELFAKKHNLPFIATSDTHILETLEQSFALIEAKAKTIPAIFEAIRQKKFRNITSPFKIRSRVFIKFFFWELNDQLAKIFRTKKLKQSTALSKKGLASLIPEEFPSLDQ